MEIVWLFVKTPLYKLHCTQYVLVHIVTWLLICLDHFELKWPHLYQLNLKVKVNVLYCIASLTI